MIAFLSLLLHVVVSPFRTKARLEAEIILLRHQLSVLRRRVTLSCRSTGAPTATTKTSRSAHHERGGRPIASSLELGTAKLHPDTVIDD